MSESAECLAIVTGAGRGIGRATALRLAEDGFRVIVVDRDPGNADHVAGEIRNHGGMAEPRVLDVTDRAAVRKEYAGVVEQYGRIDALVNNAIWLKYAPLVDFDESLVDGMFAIGIKAVLWGMQAVVPTMTAAGVGAIVNLSSPAAFRGGPGTSVYSTVKGAVTSLTTQAAVELGPLGIRVNAIIPGSIPTEGARQHVSNATYAARGDSVPLRRNGTPEDIADGIAYLLSPRAAYVNGHLLAVDGGYLVS
ncbi:SDR family NAD(P)-dependent oxidoreductase [Microbacterium sp.]|uniref:SDR family NAD(P)-dependent oxidoreductase n=1 Tax=Microbacterium sp. TaxID=51671 RepID=UPI003A8C90D2